MERVTDSNYEEIIAGAGPAVVLNFGAKWCSTCKQLDPIIEDLSREKQGRVVMGRVDVAESPLVAEKLRVLSVPTVVFLRDGKPVYHFTFTGGFSKKKISQMLAKHLGA